jgi:hypothetical protein
MVPEDLGIIGLEEESKKNKGIAEFSFTEKEKLIFPSILDSLVPKKKVEHKIIIKNGRNRTKPGQNSELF